MKPQVDLWRCFQHTEIRRIHNTFTLHPHFLRYLNEPSQQPAHSFSSPISPCNTLKVKKIFSEKVGRLEERRGEDSFL